MATVIRSQSQPREPLHRSSLPPEQMPRSPEGRRALLQPPTTVDTFARFLCKESDILVAVTHLAAKQGSRAQAVVDPLALQGSTHRKTMLNAAGSKKTR